MTRLAKSVTFLFISVVSVTSALCAQPKTDLPNRLGSAYRGLWREVVSVTKTKGKKIDLKLELYFPSAGCVYRLVAPWGKVHVSYPQVWREGKDIILLEKAQPGDPIKYPFFNWIKIRVSRVDKNQQVRLRFEYLKLTKCNLKTGRVVKTTYPKRVVWLAKVRWSAQLQPNPKRN